MTSMNCRDAVGVGRKMAAISILTIELDFRFGRRGKDLMGS